MRGPLFSGPIGSPATLDRVCRVVRDYGPPLVLSALWLAERLAQQFPVAVLVEPDKRRGARSAVRQAAKNGRALLVVVAGEDLPVQTARMGCVIVENLAGIEQDETAISYLAEMATVLRPGGLVIALDVIKDLRTEERAAGLLLAAGYTGLAQERPREGALISVGHPPTAAALTARWAVDAVLPQEERPPGAVATTD